MDSSVQTSLDVIRCLVPGVEGIIVSDKEGVLMVESTGSGCPDGATRQPFLSNTSTLISDIGKLSLGENKRILITYQERHVVQFNLDKLIATVVASTDTCMGSLMSLEDQIVASLPDMESLEVSRG